MLAEGESVGRSYGHAACAMFRAAVSAQVQSSPWNCVEYVVAKEQQFESRGNRRLAEVR